ncbi:SPRY domain-containing protein 3-like isoform X1 [Salvelinus namaycush]|uniref:SPRY domain-containing protein 3-like isoform X1 n=1 Tax=Salvelinus namaycush TaxID=8040 RepID=A0A8U1F927_SALNM|nr:SPRY domain-containing protein 3-like isoform X1 [Salvelinus namaycush]
MEKCSVTKGTLMKLAATWLQGRYPKETATLRLYNGNTIGQQFGSKCNRGDRIGCGIYLEAFEDGQTTVFFTKNGKELGTVVVLASPEALCPAVGMHSLGEEVQLDLQVEWGMEKEDGLMIVDSHEDEWRRLHDVRVTGSLLEYVGKRKSIVDVGLAQACLPLNTRCHYYELEITDAGEKCYIALGLARRDYPKNRHPGWSRGSIAYHADDGKLFQGSGVGDAFGPRCFEGDVMGCGIMFPRDYILDSGDDSDDGDSELQPKQRRVQNDLYMNDEEEDGEEGRGVLHTEWEGGGPQGGGSASRGVLSYHRHDEHRGKGQGGPAPPKRVRGEGEDGVKRAGT